LQQFRNSEERSRSDTLASFLIIWNGDKYFSSCNIRIIYKYFFDIGPIIFNVRNNL